MGGGGMKKRKIYERGKKRVEAWKDRRKEKWADGVKEEGLD